jgi:peptidoglycan/LPS O-acetylase OafA/YrhL
MQLQVEEAAIVVMLAAIIFACAAAEMRHGLRWLTRPWLLRGGEISYATYMIHMPLYVCLLKTCGVAGLISRGTIASDLVALGGAVLVVPPAMVVERFFERPAYHFTMGVLTRSPEPASSSA